MAKVYDVNDYKVALEALAARGMAASGRTMLQAHYSMPEHVATMRHIAGSIGYPHDHRQGNLRYGALAGRIRRELSMPKPTMELWAIATWGEDSIDELDEFAFRMRPQLAAALIQLGWVDDAGPVPITESSSKSAVEGQQVARMQVHRKREAWLRDAKIAEELRRSPDGRLRCAVPNCGFDFEATYGQVGVQYIQVHHLESLSSRQAPSVTTLGELLLICANCHVMVHRDGLNRDVHSLIRRA